jgi:hypothetical protein
VLAERVTTLMRGMRSKNGRAILTSGRVLFYDQKFDPKFAFPVGGIIAAEVASKLQRRHEARGPLLDLPLSEIAGIERAKKGLNKNVLVIRTRSGEEHRLLDMFEDWSPHLAPRVDAAG